jgi:choline-glycine betaine transporter
MDGATVVFLISIVASLFLALRALRSHGLSFENKAWMAVAWAVIIALVAFIVGRLAG